MSADPAQADPAQADPGQDDPGQNDRGQANPGRDADMTVVPARLVSAFTAVLGRVFVDPVRSGRPRDVGWPPGLRPVVAAGLIVFLGGLALTALSGVLRSDLMLSSAELRALYVLPRASVGILLFMIVFTLTLAQTAALHASWWIRVVITATTLGVMGVWGIRAPHLSYPGVVLGIGVLMAAVLALVIIRAKLSFAWWEFPALLALIGGSGVLSLIEDRRGVVNGVDLAPVFLQESVVVLGTLAIPVLFAAGLSVAEVTVSATVWSARVGQRLVNRPAAFVILAVAVLIWAGHAIRQIAGWDLVSAPPAAILLSLLAAGAFGLVAVWLRRVGRRGGPQPVAPLAELPEQMSRFGLSVGVGLVSIGLVFIIVLALVAVVLLLNPLGGAARSASGVVGRVSAFGPGNLSYVVLAVVALLIARWLARRSRPGSALLLGFVAVVLVASWLPNLSRDSLMIEVNLVVLDLIAGVVLLGVGLVSLLRRKLSRQRAVNLSVGLVLAGLFAGRDFVSEPIQALLGISGIGLAMFGLAWDLATGSSWANQDGRRLLVPTRLLLLLSNSTLGVTVLAYLALAAQSGGPIDPETWSGNGNLILGTALVAAAFVTVLGAVRAETDIR